MGKPVCKERCAPQNIEQNKRRWTLELKGSRQKKKKKAYWRLRHKLTCGFKNQKIKEKEKNVCQLPGGIYHNRFSWCSDGKESTSDTWIGKITWRREWVIPSSFLAWEIPWTEDLTGYRQRGHKGLDTTEQWILSLSLFLHHPIWETWNQPSQETR